MDENYLKRLPRCQRRDQLLAAALVMVREQGTEELTLCSLAHRVGITHTIAYRHFGTRSGLLIGLYEQVDARQIAALLAKLEQASPHLLIIANAISDAYMNSAIEAGVEWHALRSALKGNKEMAAVQRRSTEDYVAIYENALAPFSHLPADQLHLSCIGFLGAARAIADELIDDQIGQFEAVTTLTALIFSSLAPMDVVADARAPQPLAPGAEREETA